LSPDELRDCKGSNRCCGRINGGRIPAARAARVGRSAVFALIDEFSAEFAADPPRQPAAAGLAGHEDQREFGGDVEIFRQHAGAAVGHGDDLAVARQRAGAEMHLGAAVIGASLAFPSVRKHCDSHRHPPSRIPGRFTENLLEFA